MLNCNTNVNLLVNLFQGTIVERMIKCNHPKLGAEGSKEKLESLLQFLLQYVHDQAAQFDPELKEDEDDSG